MGYHLAKIPRGNYGEISKIEEEVAELRDADNQDCDVMVLVELSDLVGAIEGYLEEKFTGFTIQDLIKMAAITRRAFENGERQERHHD